MDKTNTLALILLLFPLLTAASPVPPNNPWPTGTEIDRVEGSMVYFRTPEGATPPKALNTSLHDLNTLGILYPAKGGIPYLLFSALPCPSCAQERAIYLLRSNGNKPVSFVYPGKIVDPKTGGILLQSRAFFGKCLSGRGDAYVVFQRERVDRRSKLQSSVFVAEVTDSNLDETLFERRLPSMEITLRYVRAKQCREIEGRNRMMLAQPLDLRPRQNLDDDDDPDDTPKESQTAEEIPPVIN